MDTDQEPNLGHPLSYVRAAHGWSATELLAVLADSARDHLGIQLGRADRNKVHRWETRGVVPEPAVQRALARALGVPDEQLAQHPWPNWLPAFSGLRPIAGWSPVGALRAIEDAISDGPDQRGYAGITGPELVTLARAWRDTAPVPLVAVVRGTLRAEEEATGRIERQAELIRRLDDQLPVDTLLAVASAQLRLIAALLRYGSFTAAICRRLLLAVTDLGQLAGSTAFDTGRHFTAQRHYRAALYAAHAAGDVTLGGYLLICLGYQAVRLGEPRSAVELAELAVGAAAGSPSARARALLAGHLRVVRVAAGADDGAVPANSHDLTPSPDDPPWADWGEAPSVAGFTGRLYQLIDGHATEPRLGRLVGPRADAGPGPVRSHRRLHRIAQRLAADPASSAAQDALPILLPPAA